MVPEQKEGKRSMEELFREVLEKRGAKTDKERRDAQKEVDAMFNGD